MASLIDAQGKATDEAVDALVNKRSRKRKALYISPGNVQQVPTHLTIPAVVRERMAKATGPKGTPIDGRFATPYHDCRDTWWKGKGEKIADFVSTEPSATSVHRTTYTC